MRELWSKMKRLQQLDIKKPRKHFACVTPSPSSTHLFPPSWEIKKVRPPRTPPPRAQAALTMALDTNSLDNLGTQQCLLTLALEIELPGFYPAAPLLQSQR